MWKRVAAAWLCLACAACASTAPGGASQNLSGPVDTGTFPNLNVPPPVATQPFDQGSLQAHRQAMATASATQRAQGQDVAGLPNAAPAEQQRLKQLAASQQETFKAIEKTN